MLTTWRGFAQVYPRCRIALRMDDRTASSRIRDPRHSLRSPRCIDILLNGIGARGPWPPCLSETALLESFALSASPGSHDDPAARRIPA